MGIEGQDSATYLFGSEEALCPASSDVENDPSTQTPPFPSVDKPIPAAIQGSISDNYFCKNGSGSFIMTDVDEQVLVQPPALGAVQNLQFPYLPPSCQPNPMGANLPVTLGQLPNPTMQAQLTPQQLSFQHMQQQALHQLDQQLKLFWATQYQDITVTQDFRNHSLPLARIKKIMKADEEVRMIAAEAPVLFARACEMFILELTYRSWAHAEESKRRTLQKSDIAGVITSTETLDFLVDMVPKEEIKEEASSPIPGSGDPSNSLPYYYMTPQVGSLGMMMSKSEIDQATMMYAQQPLTYMSQQLWREQQQSNQHQQQPSDDSSLG